MCWAFVPGTRKSLCQLCFSAKTFVAFVLPWGVSMKSLWYLKGVERSGTVLEKLVFNKVPRYIESRTTGVLLATFAHFHSFLNFSIKTQANFIAF